MDVPAYQMIVSAYNMRLPAHYMIVFAYNLKVPASRLGLGDKLQLACTEKGRAQAIQIDGASVMLPTGESAYSAEDAGPSVNTVSCHHHHAAYSACFDACRWVSLRPCTGAKLKSKNSVHC